jgi:hypothetical protein
MAFIEWVDLIEPSAPEPENKGTKKAPKPANEDKSAKP